MSETGNRGPRQTRSRPYGRRDRSSDVNGIDHQRLTFRFQGLDHRLTGVEEAHVVKRILT